MDYIASFEWIRSNCQRFKQGACHLVDAGREVNVPCNEVNCFKAKALKPVQRAGLDVPGNSIKRAKGWLAELEGQGLDVREMTDEQLLDYDGIGATTLRELRKLTGEKCPYCGGDM